MSQDKGKFQSKPKFGGQKFGGKGKGGKPAPRSGAKRSFGDRSEGDRGAPRKEGGFGDKPRFDRNKPAGARPGGKSRFEGRSDDRPRGDRPYGDKPRGARPFGDKPSYGKKPFGGRDDRKGGFGDRPRSDRPRDDRPRDDRPRGDRPYGDKPRGDRPYGDKPRGARPFGDKPAYGKKPFGGRDDRPRDDRPRGDRPYGDKPRGDRPYGDKPRGDRPSYGDKPRSYGDKPRGDRPYGDKPRGDRPYGDKPRGGKSFDKKPFRPREDERDDRAGDTRPAKSWQRYEENPHREASDETRGKLKSGRSSYGSPSPSYLYGVHAVSQALLNGERKHKRLLCTEKGYASIEAVCTKAMGEGLSLPEITYVEKEDIDRLLSRDAVHQDVLLDCEALEDVFLIDILNDMPEDAKVVVLDQVTDPHNVGAILRSAAAFGATAVVVQKLNAPEITGVLAKSASGAVEHVPMVREVNLSRAITQLKEAGFFCVGLAEKGKDELSKTLIKGRVALVLGAEGEGLRRLVAESCDALAYLPTGGEIGSLNVSNAAAIALYEIARADGK